MGGGVRFGNQPSLYYRMLKAMIIKIDKGLPPMLPYTEKLTGKKFSYWKGLSGIPPTLEIMRCINRESLRSFCLSVPW